MFNDKDGNQKDSGKVQKEVDAVTQGLWQNSKAGGVTV